MKSNKNRQIDIFNVNNIMNNRDTDKRFIMSNTIRIANNLFENNKLPRSIKVKYESSFELSEPKNLAEILVINDHALNIVDELAHDKKLNIAVMQNLSIEFSGNSMQSLNGIYDPLIPMRTNFCKLFSCDNDEFPISDGYECVCSPKISLITKIVNDNLVFIDNPKTELTNIVLISCANLCKPVFIDNDKILSSNDYLKTLEILETIFQIAIKANCNSLILTPYGIDDKLPQNDIINVFNYCLFKYNHMFKYIIFAIPNYKESLYKLYKDKINTFMD